MGRSELGQRRGREEHSGESEGEREEETQRDSGDTSPQVSAGHSTLCTNPGNRLIQSVYTHDSCQEPPQ